MKKFSTIMLVFLPVMMLFSIASASTTLEYDGECTYFDAKAILKYSGDCRFNWGVGMLPDPDNRYYQRYIMTYPNGNDVWIYINADGSATVNDIVATSIESKEGYEKVKTIQGEIFEFTRGSEPE